MLRLFALLALFGYDFTGGKTYPSLLSTLSATVISLWDLPRQQFNYLVLYRGPQGVWIDGSLVNQLDNLISETIGRLDRTR